MIFLIRAAEKVTGDKTYSRVKGLWASVVGYRKRGVSCRYSGQRSS